MAGASVARTGDPISSHCGRQENPMLQAPLMNWASGHKPQLRLSLRITVASLATFAIGHLLGLTQSYWAVLTALIVSQASVGGSLKAARDRFVGSLGGAAWGVAVSLGVPHATIWGLALTVTLALAPLALVTALNSAYRIAPVTAVILLLTPTSQHAGTLATATGRLLEIALGSTVALAAALLVLPERAHENVARAASQALELMASLATHLLGGAADDSSRDAAADLHGRIRKAIISAEAAADEAASERRANLAAGADTEPLCRTLRRLHNDLIMLGRASQTPLPQTIRDALGAPAADAANAIAGFLRDAGQALASQAPAPSMADLERVLSAYRAAVTAVRRAGLTRELPDEAVGRMFSLTFALDQLRLNLRDLSDRAAEMAGSTAR
jgi:uncharacterized membrane protein YccC